MNQQIEAAQQSIDGVARLAAEAEVAAQEAAQQLAAANAQATNLQSRLQACQAVVSGLREKARTTDLTESESAKLNLTLMDAADLTRMHAEQAAQIAPLAAAAQATAAEHARRGTDLDTVKRMLQFQQALVQVRAAEQALVEAMVHAEAITKKGSLPGVGSFGSWACQNRMLSTVYRHGTAPSQALPNA